MKKLTLLLTLTVIAFSSCQDKKVKLIKSTPTLYEIEVAGRYGLVDSSGKIVVNPQFDNIFIPYHDKNYELIGVRLGAKLGFIDRKGQFKINPQFDYDTIGVPYLPEFSEGFAIVHKDNLYGFIDTTGKIVLKMQYEDCHFFQEGLASFKKNRKWGFIDKTGKVIIEPHFDQAYFFENGIAEIRKFAEGETDDYPSLSGYINKKGKVIWQPSK